MKYFAHCKTLEALKNEYKRLAKLHHPDIGGDQEIMKMINAEYDDAVKYIADNPTHADSKRAKQETPEAFRDIISALVKLSDIVIELCGSWIWVTGNTYPHRDALKAAGCRWASKKCAWYWHTPEDECRRGKRELSLDEIRERHGSTLIATTGKAPEYAKITI